MFPQLPGRCVCCFVINTITTPQTSVMSGSFCDTVNSLDFTISIHYKTLSVWINVIFQQSYFWFLWYTLSNLIPTYHMFKGSQNVKQRKKHRNECWLPLTSGLALLSIHIVCALSNLSKVMMSEGSSLVNTTCCDVSVTRETLAPLLLPKTWRNARVNASY